ncbi:MAG: A/G-specific adenine glycosylase, partial [Actinomycetota bacterium]|nr:A/G-specific adenine glycosylase [Actinomycetota bacterium]
VEALLPPEPAAAARMSIAMMELGALICTARAPRCADCPIADLCAWRHAGSPPYQGPAARSQRFVGTDRQVRGRLLDVVRATPDPVTRAALDIDWPDRGQLSRALDSLVADGLVDALSDNRYALPS